MQHFTPNLEKISAATRLFLHLMPERHGQTDGRTWDTKVGYLLTGFFFRISDDRFAPGLSDLKKMLCPCPYIIHQ